MLKNRSVKGRPFSDVMATTFSEGDSLIISQNKRESRFLFSKMYLYRIQSQNL